MAATRDLMKPDSRNSNRGMLIRVVEEGGINNIPERTKKSAFKI
jgi:hypothetical protein